MTTLAIVSIIITAAAFFGWLSVRVCRLPITAAVFRCRQWHIFAVFRHSALEEPILVCHICRQPLDIGTARTDGGPNAVHSGCYAMSISGISKIHV
jgi:hypothetical protein